MTPSTEVIPGLAEDLPTISSDGKTYTLNLRQGMKYSDGTPIKASDFKFAVERLFNVWSRRLVVLSRTSSAPSTSRTARPTRSRGITTNDQTGKITIKLKQPSGTFINELGLMFVAPIPQDTPNADDPAGLTNNPPPSSGPFMITNVDAPRSYTLERNPQFKTLQMRAQPMCRTRTSTRSR